MRRVTLAAVLVVAALLPASARADNFEEYGFGARSQGMGTAFTALASDMTATYYNPGGLILSRHVNLTLGYSFADYYLTFDSERGGPADGKAERIPDLSALTLGISTTIPWDIPDRFAFGLGLIIPTRGVIDLESSSVVTRPEWFKYGRRHDRIAILATAAVKITDWLSFGAGANIFVDAVGSTNISVDIAGPVTPDFQFQLKADAGAVVGAMLFPADWISFGLTYRSEVSMKLDFPAVAQIQGVSLPITLEAITHFQPHQVQFGVAVNITSDLLVSFDFAYYNWSAYTDPFLVVSSNVAAVQPRVKADLNDVFSPKIGAELYTTDWLVLRGGYWYRSSVTPDQDNEPTNLVDSAKHVFTFGVGFLFGQGSEDPTAEAKKEEGKGEAQTIDEALADSSFDLDFFFQYHFHESVSATKPATDPIGSWDADGGIINFGFQLTARF